MAYIKEAKVYDDNGLFLGEIEQGDGYCLFSQPKDTKCTQLDIGDLKQLITLMENLKHE
jgi:hypothetical protein